MVNHHIWGYPIYFFQMYPYYSGLEGYGLGGLKLKTQQTEHTCRDPVVQERKEAHCAQLLCFQVSNPFGYWIHIF